MESLGKPTYLTRRASGLCMITYRLPVATEVGKTGIMDAYAIPGDPLGFYPVCDWAVKNVFNSDLPKEGLWSTRMIFYGQPLGAPFRLE